MSNPYLYNPKVLHAGDILPQMTSNEYQPQYYFGGSQVPDALKTEHHTIGKGIYKKVQKTITGKGVKHHTLPLNIPSIKRY